MKKIAFIALTYSSFQREDVMHAFFNPKHSQYYNLYIHNKDRIDDSYFNSHTLQRENIVQTAWGQYSLVEATLSLLRVALEDPDNEKFILLSDSHCPLYSMPETYSKVFQNFKRTSFGCNDNRLARHRFFKAFHSQYINDTNFPIAVGCAQYVQQWFICNRADAITYVKNAEKYDKYFRKESDTYVDEMYFVVLANHLKIHWTNQKICDVDWNQNTNKKFIAMGCRERPYTYDNITGADIYQKRKTGALFMRKIHKQTVIDTSVIYENT